MARPVAAVHGRNVGVLLAVLLVAGSAQAAPKHKVRIETEPPGATVFVEDKESGAAGTTPVELMLPEGEHTIILELDRYLAQFQVITIDNAANGRTPPVFRFTLEPALATVIVVGDELPPGAVVQIDGTEHGPVPARVEVEAGAHQVQVVAPGRPPFETWVEVAGGAEETVRVTLPPPAGTAPAPPPASHADTRGSYVTAGAGYEIGWRRFRYEQPRTPNALPFDADKAGLLTVWAEVHPHRAFAAARPLWPLSLVLSVGYGLPLETRLADRTVDALWRTTQASLRWRLTLAEYAAVDVDAGWSRLLYTFHDRDGESVDEVPDVDYQTIQLGLRFVGRLAATEAWLGFENRIVVSGGALEDRFRNAEVDGYAFRFGVGRWWLDERLATRVELSWARYGWTFTPERMDPFQADGGTDDLYGLMLAAGYSY